MRYYNNGSDWAEVWDHELHGTEEGIARWEADHEYELLEEGEGASCGNCATCMYAVFSDHPDERVYKTYCHGKGRKVLATRTQQQD